MRFTSRALVAAVALIGSAATLSPAMAAAGSDDDRLPAVVTRHTDDYDFELILTSHPGGPGSPTAWVRRTDDVGSAPANQPDSHGFVQESSWNAQSGPTCVTSGGSQFSFEGSPVHGFTYGITGRVVRKVVVVLKDGTQIHTRTSRATVDGFRGWLVERPLVTTARVDGYDSHGRRVASFTVDHEFSDTFDYDLADTCVPYPGS